MDDCLSGNIYALSWGTMVTPRLCREFSMSTERGYSTRSPHAVSLSNCSARDSCRLQAYFACCLRIMWIISTPPRITRADTIDLNPSIDRTLRLIAR